MKKPESSGDVIAEQEGANPEQPVVAQEQEVKKEPDNYYKNKAFELERKYNRATEEIAEIKKLIQEHKKSPQEEPQYTEDQLRAALSSNDLTPEQRSFANKELKKIEERRLEERDKKILDEIERRNRDSLTRQQAEQQLLSDTRFQDAFVRLPNGTVQWNESSELARMIGVYMQDPALSGRPDGTLIAAKLAYADITTHSKETEAQKLKREAERIKSQTFVEGGGKNFNESKKDPYVESLDRLKGGDKYAGPSAVREYLRKRGAFGGK